MTDEKWVWHIEEAIRTVEIAPTVRLGSPRRSNAPQRREKTQQSILGALSADWEVTGWLLVIVGIICGAVTYLNRATDGQAIDVLLALAIGALMWRVLGRD